MKTLSALVLSTALTLAHGPAQAQENPYAQGVNDNPYSRICMSFIEAVALGGAEAAQTLSGIALVKLANDTGGAGRYEIIDRVGALRGVQVSEITSLTHAEVFQCSTNHERGNLQWVIAYSPISQTVADYRYAFIPAERQSPPNLSGVQATAQAPEAPSRDEACAQFPDLC